MKQPKIGADVVDARYDSVFRDVAGIVTPPDSRRPVR